MLIVPLMTKSLLIGIWLLFFQMTLTFASSDCDQLVGSWLGFWKIKEKVQSANVTFDSLFGNEFSGYFILENQTGETLNGTCQETSFDQAKLKFEEEAPLYNPCFGEINGLVLHVWCKHPNQEGWFQKGI